MENQTEMLKGLLEGCVLELIGRGETYGYEITQHLHQLGFEEVAPGTVYTITSRLDRKGLVRTEKRMSKLGPERTFFILNDEGRAALNAFWERWRVISEKINWLKESRYEPDGKSLGKCPG
ncbi:MAG: PadR family transcriptional regulator [Clostridiales bacterium]|nr:PadR family transcriptional regulator [Clostridiales bacterium]